MCFRAVVILHIQKQHVAQVPLAEDDDVVKIVPPARTNQPFRMPILPRRARRNWPITNTHGAKPPSENLAIDPVAIADDVAWVPFPPAGFGELPGNPFGAGVCRHSQP